MRAASRRRLAWGRSGAPPVTGEATALRRGAVAAALGLLLTAAAAVAAAAADANPLAVTLAGEEVSAADLGPRSLLVVSFHRAANAGAREWRSALDDEPRAAGWSTYSVVVLEGAPGFIRRMIVRTLRGEVADARHGSYLVVEDGAGAWRELAGSDGEGEDRADAVFVLRLEAGKICGRYRGLVSGAAVADLLDTPCRP